MVESTPLTLIEVEGAQPRIIRGYISVEKALEYCKSLNMTRVDHEVDFTHTELFSDYGIPVERFRFQYTRKTGTWNLDKQPLR